MAAAQRDLVRKAIAELAHERLVEPRAEDDSAADGNGQFALTSDDGGTDYRFRARRLALDHWLIDAGSIVRTVAQPGAPLDAAVDAPLDAMDFVTDFAGTLGIEDAMLGTYLEEISSTLQAGAFRRTRQVPDAGGLTAAGFQSIESSMSAGHPCFIANSGRIGFDAADYLAYAPESGRRLHLMWVAVHRGRSVLATSASLHGGDELLENELGAQQLQGFRDLLVERGLDPADYHLIPVHPWQWRHKICITLATDIAEGYVVGLGPGDAAYQPQQSIRTLFNADHPRRCYVKTSLSILNMGFMRGLSPGYMAVAPAINDWVHDLVQSDPALRSLGFQVLREVAAIGYEARHYTEAAPGSGHTKMLSALWRESPAGDLAPGERLATMASLLHVDDQGDAHLPALIAASGLEPAEWLRRYLDAYLSPLLHCFYAHGLVFMPHGENLIMVLRDHVPVRMLMKDIGEEVAVLDADIALPPEVERIRADVPEEAKLLSIFTDVFDCIFRFVNAILLEHGDTGEDVFWSAVAGCIADYQRAHPEFADAFARHDLFAPEFARSCLNRLQLRDNQQMVDLTDPASALAISGTLSNPIARFAPRR